MPLVLDEAIVSPTEAEAISGEDGLALLDGTGGATLANACKQATNFLISWAEGERGLDVSKIANTDRLKLAAGLEAARRRLAAQPGEDSKARAQRLALERDQALARYVFASTDASDTDTALAENVGPRVWNQNGPVFGQDNTRPRPY